MSAFYYKYRTICSAIFQKTFSSKEKKTAFVIFINK